MKNKTQEQTDDRSLKVIEIQKSIKEYEPVAGAITIKSAEDLKKATEVEANIKARLKKIEELRKFFVEDITKKVNEINKEFRGLKKPYEEMFEQVDAKVIEYRRIEREKQEKERLKAEEKARKQFEKQRAKEQALAEKEAERQRKLLEKQNLSKKAQKEEEKRIEEEKAEKLRESEQTDFNFNDADFKQNKTIHSDAGSATFRKDWDFKIIDETKVPREYLIVDEKAIRNAIKKNGVRSIEGIEIFETENSSFRL